MRTKLKGLWILLLKLEIMKIEPVFKTTLAEDVPTGPQGQPAHKKGSEVNIASMIETKRLGSFLMVTPNPVFFYLNSAEENIKDIGRLLRKIDSTNKQVVFPGSSVKPAQTFRDLDDRLVYQFYEKAIEVPILLFTAIEAFSNQLIPKDFVYKKKKAGLLIFERGKMMNKVEVERWVGSDEKLSKVLHGIKNKQLKDTHLWSEYKKIKKLRDEVTHLKTREQSSVVAYNQLYKDLVDVDYQGLFNSTKELIEFYVPDYF